MSNKHFTLDGGPKSDEPIVLEIYCFSVSSLDVNNDLHLTALEAAFRRAYQVPTPLCGACNYEFEVGEVPAMLYYTKPFIQKGRQFATIMGSICPNCAERSSRELSNAIAALIAQGFGLGSKVLGDGGGVQ